jgi:hypothetical protein
MERLTTESCHCSIDIDIPSTANAPITGVTHDWIACKLAVHTNLVGAAGVEATLPK